VEIPRARATEAIAVVTAIAWALIALARADEVAALLGGFIPARFTPDLSGLVALMPGPNGGWFVPAILTPLSATLLHGGALHLGMNLLMLVWCGRFTEAAIGPRCMVLLYLVGAYAAAATQFLWDPGSTVPMIGASGAISAVVGAYALLFNQNEIRAIGPIPASVIRIAWLAAAWIGVQALFGLIYPHIAIAAHIGGFLAGLALGRPLLLWHYRKA